ncbi:hypothetical protein P6144_15245 [Sphingomonas sp. HITSZ_GF]|uniref:hypothetical protein n=1 Tax=Sphingomonas sp. HITSZ_GF TaxID=3037247 RepID=UPI00240E8DD9|nr:hypothetical protein [Sphingomonas sp. HITSZ_GF]MDG2535014.1 hypothetical protein [Sphingomonas sp. HITSZ_GF]
MQPAERDRVLTVHVQLRIGALAIAAAGCALAAQDIIIGAGPSSRSSTNSTPPAETEKARQHRLAVDAEVRRLGEHRRPEAERIVEMRERAAAARQPVTPASKATPAPSPTASAKADPNRASCIIAPTKPYGGIPQCPAYVPRPNLPKTTPPKGYWDRNQFITVTNAADAKPEYDRLYGTCRGTAQFLHSACYPDGQGRYSCQAVVRCKLADGTAKARAQ